MPPLAPEKAAEYASLFEKSGAQGGLLSGKSTESFFLLSLIARSRRKRKANIRKVGTLERGAGPDMEPLGHRAARGVGSHGICYRHASACLVQNRRHESPPYQLARWTL